jgi:hypothetical protein
VFEIDDILINDLVSDMRYKLKLLFKEFESSPKAMDENTGFEGTAQLEVYSRGCDWNVIVAEELLHYLQ